MQFPLPPRTLLQNRYSIVRKIGQGSMGAVYEAKDQRLGHRVALKQRIVNGPEVERAFEREARILATLRHAALPAVSDYFIEESHQFLVMQYIAGDDLETLLQRQGRPFGVTQVLEWADQLLGALEYLHSQSPPIIHRDIKPENIKLSVRGEVILLDFGISKGGGSNNTHLTMGGASIAAFTPNYAPLEQIESKGTEQRSDLYSLGVTLHHLLTGVLPPTAITRATAPIYANPDPLRPANELNPQVPAALATLLTEATALNHTQRPDSASAMRAMLKAAPAPAARKEVPLYDPARSFSPNTPPPPAEPRTPAPAPPTEKFSAAPVARKEVPLYEPESPVFPKWPNTPPPPAEPPTPAPAPPTEKWSQAPVVFKTTKKLNTKNGFLITFVGFFAFSVSLFAIIHFSKLLRIFIPDNINCFIFYALIFASFVLIMLSIDSDSISPRPSEIDYIDSKKLAVARGAIYLYDATTLDQETCLGNGYFFPVQVQSMALSPDGVTLAEASGKTIKLWDVVSGVVRSTLTLKGSLATLKCLAFSPDGARVASALDDGTIRLWDIDSGTVRTTLVGHSAAVNSVAFSPDGATLASASDDKSIKLWDLATESLRSTLIEHSEPINSIAFSPDGTLLASASDDKSIKFWHTPTATFRATLRGHTARVNRVTFSPNGDLLASASDDNTAQLWHVASGTLRAKLLDHTKEVTSVAFSPDGQTLASTSKDGTVRLWDLSPLDEGADSEPAQ